MSDNFQLTPGSGATALGDEVTDATFGTGGVQYVKVMDGTPDSTLKWIIQSDGSALVAFPSAQHVIVDSGSVSVTGTVNASAATVPTDQIRSSTATVSFVNSSITSVQLLASNTSRRQCTFFNDSTSVCYLKPGTAASTTSFMLKMDPGGYEEFYGYTGVWHGIWVSVNGAMRIAEFT